MVMKESMKQCEINSPTLKEYKIIKLEETHYSTDDAEANEGNKELRHSNTCRDVNNDDNSTPAALSSHESISQDNIENLKSKLHQVLKKRDQYKRRVESLTNGIISLRGRKMILKRKISRAKVLWEIKDNMNINYM
ncbi:hypothetical protein PV325_007028 [Microctonus aethiopoides]|nr:hypothetical protein PV325_007028 [Microctonus aethiopoides]KAK0096230.1 hypothetical protein PV326_006059 [Microctonus aethiopoides]KAK0166277.1 hypothetical protein PV328_004712 [Microctonus aethiopoides]